MFGYLIQVLKDSDKARREVILHKKASENCDYIVQVLDVYVCKRFLFRKFETLFFI